MIFDLLPALTVTNLLVGALVVILGYLARSYFQEPPNLPPMPPCKPYFFLGHLPYLKGGPREKMLEWREQCGDVFRVYYGNIMVVVVNGYKAVKDCLVTQGDYFSDRPPNRFAPLVQDGEKGVLTSSGHIWKEQRQVTINILKAFGMGKNSLSEKIAEEVTAYLNVLGDLKGKPANVRSQTHVAIANIICSIIVGKRFEYNDPYLLGYLHILNEQVQLTGTGSIVNWFPWLRYLPFDMFNVKKIVKNSDATTDYFSDRYINKYAKDLNENHIDNFIEMYLVEMKKKEDGHEDTTMDKGNLRRCISNLFIAGSETTTTTIQWFILYMIHYPEIQKKCYDEIEAAVGTERVPNMHDRTKLNYLNATITETSRLSSITPFSLPRMATETRTINGYTIPKGANVFPNLDSVLLDKETWGDPMNFRPERFLDDKGGLDVREEFIPFAIGKRYCLGEALARMELFLFLGAMVQRFEILPATPGEKPPRKATFGVACPPVAFDARFVERRVK